MGSSGEIMLRVICVLDVEEAGIPTLELRPERVIENPAHCHFALFRSRPHDGQLDLFEDADVAF